MRGSLQLSFEPDAVALCGASQLALFDLGAKSITEWSKNIENTLVRITPLVEGPVNNTELLAKSRWALWAMAENAPVVVCLADTGGLGVLRPQQYQEYPSIHAQRILQVDPKGAWALLQCRQDALLVCLVSGRILETYPQTGCVYKTATQQAAITDGHLVWRSTEKTSKAKIPTTNWIPVAVHIGAKGNVYILNTSRKNQTVTTQVHQWDTGKMQCTRIVTFDDPCFAFTTVGPDERWCCEWPRKKGYVVQDADGHGNSLTCSFPPLSYDGTIVYSTPQDRERLIFGQ